MITEGKLAISGKAGREAENFIASMYIRPILADIYRQLRHTMGEVQSNRGSQHRFGKGKSPQTNDYFLK